MIALVIYLLGLVSTPIIIGAAGYKRTKIDIAREDDRVVLVLVSFMWPFVLIVLTIFYTVRESIIGLFNFGKKFGQVFRRDR